MQNGDETKLFWADMLVILRELADKTGYEAIAASMNELLGVEGKWTADIVGNIYRGRKALKQEWINEFIWAHSFAPYEAVRAIARRQNKVAPKDIIEFDDETFMHSPLRFLPETGPIIHYLNELPKTDLYDIITIKFTPGSTTGRRHHRRGCHEIAECLEGDIEIRFFLQAGEEKRVKLGPGKHVAYNAELPHTAREIKGQPAALRIISIRNGSDPKDRTIGEAADKDKGKKP